MNLNPNVCKDKLDCVDVVLKLAELKMQQLRKLDELVQSVFEERFPCTSGTTVRLGDISAIMPGIKSSKSCSQDDGGVTLFRLCNIKENQLDDASLMYVPPEYSKHLQNKALRDGDILVAQSGRPGTACVVPEGYEGSQVFGALVVRIDAESSLEPSYICRYVNTALGRKYRKGGATYLGKATLAQLPIYEPTEEELRDWHGLEKKVKTLAGTIGMSLKNCYS